MSEKIKTEKQRALFDHLKNYDKLVLGAGSEDAKINIVGKFHIKQWGSEDRLDMGEGEGHVHINWSALNSVEYDSSDRRGGLLIFKDRNNQTLFRLCNPGKAFDSEISQWLGTLI